LVISLSSEDDYSTSPQRGSLQSVTNSWNSRQKFAFKDSRHLLLSRRNALGNKGRWRFWTELYHTFLSLFYSKFLTLSVSSQLTSVSWNDCHTKFQELPHSHSLSIDVKKRIKSSRRRRSEFLEFITYFNYDRTLHILCKQFHFEEIKQIPDMPSLHSACAYIIIHFLNSIK
jgi:hypothetical protein